MQPSALQELSITEALHIQGWQHLDAVILAALSTEFPTLLIGSHGTAKTLLVERLSEVMDLAFRHYNASLLNYDDLVGIPIPEDGQDQLRFITTPGAIWDGEFVFFDEISRCRPDLQNKLFPIIHERRVIGMNLTNLRYRWAAMNPPSPDNPDMDTASGDLYLGSEPLDPALADRFPFVISVPMWRDLDREQRRKLLSLTNAHSDDSTKAMTLPLVDLVDACREQMQSVTEEYGTMLADYVIAVMDLLDKAQLPQSPRRARMLVEAIVAVHAARLTTESDDVELSDSAELTLLYGLPQNATEVPPTPASLVAIHKQAWEITYMLDDEVWRQILEETDPLKRIMIADELGVSDEDLSRLITQALNIEMTEARKTGLATAMFLRFKQYRNLTPAAWEPLTKLAGRVLLPRQVNNMLSNSSSDMNIWNEIKPWVIKRREEGNEGKLAVNYVLGGFPELWRNENWQDSLKQFWDDLKFFNVEVS